MSNNRQYSPLHWFWLRLTFFLLGLHSVATLLTKDWIYQRQAKNPPKFVHKLVGIVRMNEIRIERRIWK